MDVSTAFLNGQLNEKVYMKLPDDLEKYLQEIMIDERYGKDKILYNKVKMTINELKKPNSKNACLLKKAIYGLKQSGRQWYNKLDTKLKELKFIPSHADPCIYL